jgi:hypothetical protein
MSNPMIFEDEVGTVVSIDDAPWRCQAPVPDVAADREMR